MGWRALRAGTLALLVSVPVACVPVAPASVGPVSAEPDVLLPGPLQPLLHERFTARVSAMGFPVARVVGELVPGCGAQKGLLFARSRATATPFVELLRKVEGDVETEVDARSGTARSHRSEERDGPVTRRYAVRFGPRSFDYSYDRKEGERTQHAAERVLFPPNEPVHELHTAGLLLRRARLRPGATTHFHVALGRRIWRVELRAEGPDVVVDDDGPGRAAMRWTGSLTKLLAEPDGKHISRRFELWISRDKLHLPLRLLIESPLGLLRLDLAEHELLADPCEARP